MSSSKVCSAFIQYRLRRSAAAALLSTAALLSAAACSGQSGHATASVESSRSSTRGAASSGATASATTAASGPATAVSVPATTASAAAGAGTTTSAGHGTSVGAAGPTPCGNAALEVSWGYGTNSQPQQYSAVDFVNVSDQTCTLYGYPGLSIKVDGTVINAARTLSGTEPALKSPQLVTLAPGGKAYAIAQWMLTTPGRACYPTGTGTFDAIAPNTTRTFVLSSSAHIGSRVGICSDLAINPVQLGTYGVAAGS